MVKNNPVAGEPVNDSPPLFDTMIKTLLLFIFFWIPIGIILFLLLAYWSFFL